MLTRLQSSFARSFFGFHKAKRVPFGLLRKGEEATSLVGVIHKEDAETIVLNDLNFRQWSQEVTIETLQMDLDVMKELCECHVLENDGNHILVRNKRNDSRKIMEQGESTFWLEVDVSRRDDKNTFLQMEINAWRNALDQAVLGPFACLQDDEIEARRLVVVVGVDIVFILCVCVYVVRIYPKLSFLLHNICVYIMPRSSAAPA